MTWLFDAWLALFVILFACGIGAADQNDWICVLLAAAGMTFCRAQMRRKG